MPVFIKKNSSVFCHTAAVLASFARGFNLLPDENVFDRRR